MGSDRLLKWHELSSENVLHTRIMDVREKKCRSETGLEGDYYVIDSSNWVTTIPVRDGKFLCVRQWRHGMNSLSIEFPGGVINDGEAPESAAARETEEETGYRANKLTLLAELNPNPAIYTNKVYFYLAEELEPLGEQHLDEDELIDFTEIPIDEVIRSYGTGEYRHVFLGAAIGLYLMHLRETER